jgi:hypothetical protein
MSIVKPIFAIEALNHEGKAVVKLLLVVGRTAITIQIKESLVVRILAVGKILVVGQHARLRKSTVAAVALEVQFGV